MTILEKLEAICKELSIRSMTGELEGLERQTPPDEYVVLVPISDLLDEYSDDTPGVERNSVRLSIFTKKNYKALRTRLRNAILAGGLSITGQDFIEKESTTGYYHYEIDVEDITYLQEE